MLRIFGFVLAAFFLLILAAPAFSLQSRSPYAGEEQRGIKALSAADAEAYRKGEGMGFAKAAELNHYPGPKHVLELSGKLGLTEEQAKRGREIYARMHAEAVRLGKQIVEKEKALDRLFTEEKITATALSQVTAEIARLQGELRAAHLKAHLEMKQVLTAAQVTKYDALRGYGGAGSRSREHAGHAEQ